MGMWGVGTGGRGEGKAGTMGMWGRGGIAWPWGGRGYSWAKGAQSGCGAEGGGHTAAMGHCGAKGAMVRLWGGRGRNMVVGQAGARRGYGVKGDLCVSGADGDMAWLWGGWVHGVAMGQTRARHICGADRFQSWLRGGWGTAWLWGRQAPVWPWGGGGYGAGRLMTWLWGRAWLRVSQRGPRAQSALWGHPPCPNQPPNSLGGAPPKHFQPIRSLGALTSSVTRQTPGQRVPLGTLPAAAVVAGQHPWMPPPRRAAGAGGGIPRCIRTPPAPRSPRRGRIWPGEASAGWQAAAWRLAFAFPWHPSAMAAPRQPPARCHLRARAAPHLHFLHKILQVKCSPAFHGVCPLCPQDQRGFRWLQYPTKGNAQSDAVPQNPLAAPCLQPLCVHMLLGYPSHASPSPPLAPAVGFSSPSAQE